jgi:hypothetical protein
VRRLLESPRVIAVSALAAILLTATAWFTGLQTEDWVQRALVTSGAHDFPWRVNLYGPPGVRSLEAAEQQVFVYRVLGWFPWLTSARFDISFWRPLASATHLVEYRHWPGAPWAMHLASSLGYGALAAAVAVLYRRLATTPFIAGLAAVLYAVDDAHGHAVGWLANRNAILAALFGVLALVFLDRGHREGSRASAVLSPLCLGLALLSAELGLSVVGYRIAYLLFVETRSWPRRLLGLLPWAAVVALWALVYRGLGHAAHGSGLYVSPVDEPVTFLFQLSERATVLVAGQLAGPPADLWTLVDRDDQGKVVLAGAVVVWVVARLLWPLLRTDTTCRFWAAGAVLSVPPACAAFPEDRLLFFVGLGAMPVLATFLARAFSRDLAAWPRPRLARYGALGLAAVHVVIAPVLLPYRTLYMHRYDGEMRRDGAALFQHVVDPATDTLILVNAQDLYFASMLPLSRSARGEPIVGRMITLAGTRGPVRITRTDARTLHVQPEGGFMTRVLNRIFRGRDDPFAYGAPAGLPGIDIRVVEVDPWGEALEATFTFDHPLESPSYRWVTWTGTRYAVFTLPKVGETLVIRSAT